MLNTAVLFFPRAQDVHKHGVFILVVGFFPSFCDMAEDDGLLLNLSSYSDGQEIYPGKIDRKSKVKCPNKYQQERSN